MFFRFSIDRLQQILAVFVFPLAIASCAGGDGPAAPAPTTTHLNEGEVVVAVVPVLTGDPERDFKRVAQQGDVVTFYVIAGSIAESVSSYHFGLEISEAAVALLTEVRAPGSVGAYQNSIGNFVGANVAAPDDCFDINSETVIAEIDLMWQQSGALTVRLTGSNAFADPPDYQVCNGPVMPFDTETAPDVSIAILEVVNTQTTSYRQGPLFETSTKDSPSRR